MESRASQAAAAASAAALMVLVFALSTADYGSQDPVRHEFAHAFGRLIRGDPHDARLLDIVLFPEQEVGSRTVGILQDYLEEQGADPSQAREFGQALGDVVGKTLHKHDPKKFGVAVGYHLASLLTGAGLLDVRDASQRAAEAAAVFHDVMRGRDLSSLEVKIVTFLDCYSKYFAGLGMPIGQLMQGIVRNAKVILT